MTEITQKIKGLPHLSGVYIMKDSEGRIIYVGKAVSLKNRVSTYFNAGKKHPKVEAMVLAVGDFEYIVTRTEMDALILESNLVKKHKPRYNILLKDDKSAPYIRVCLKDEYPAFSIVRRLKKDGAKYFGPYMAGIRAGEIIGVLQACFQVKTCNTPISKKRGRVCLNCHIHLCMGVCAGEVDREKYIVAVRRAIEFLQGKDDGVTELITERMNRASELERFESAIMYRNQLNMLVKLKERAVTKLDRFVDLDCIAAVIDEENGLAAVSVLVVRAGKMMGLMNFPLDGVSHGEEDLTAKFIRQYYSTDTIIPPEICVTTIEDKALTEEFLSRIAGRNVQITQPKIGAKKKLLETAGLNATEYLEKNIDLIKRRSEMTNEAVDKLQETLKLPHRPARIECYDISHISGTDQVAAMVVFKDGIPDKSQYRKFKIKTVVGADDYASIREVLGRRLKRLEQSTDDWADSLPDLLVIDGGKGQLGAVRETLASIGIDIPVIALAERAEEIFVPDNPDPVILPRSSPELKLLIRLRDETHRFAVTYHRKLRSKTYSSELTKIKGVGPQKAKILLERFSYEEIKTASPTLLMAAEGISEGLAKDIAEYFKS